MAFRLTKLASVLGAVALLTASACSEGGDSGGDGDGDGDMGDGDGDMGDGDGDMGDGDGDMGDGDGDMGDGDGDGPTGEIRYSFDSDDEGFVVAFENGLGTGAGGAGGAASFASEIGFEGSDGDPEDGALMVTIPFETDADTPAQKSQIALLLDPALDLTDKVVNARVKLVSGLSDAECPGGAKMFAKTGSTWADGGWVNLDEGTWIDVNISISSPSYDDGIDPGEISEIGIEFVTGEACVSTEAVILVDSISY